MAGAGESAPEDGMAMRAEQAVEWMYGATPPRRHGAAALTAALLSLAIHGLAILQLPPLQVFQAPDAPAPAPPPEAFRLGEVQARPPEPAPALHPPVFVPEEPGGTFEGPEPTPAARSPEPALAALAPPDREWPGETAALAAPPPTTALPVREPRIARMEIAEPIVPALAARRPRRVAEHVPRETAAPDITDPAEPLAHVAPWPDRDPFLDQPLPEAPLAAGGDAPGGVHPGGIPDPALHAPARTAAAAEASGRAVRALDQPGEVQPIDRYLAFDLEVYRPPDEPEVLYYRVAIRRAGPDALPVLPRDVLLIVDCSQSMTQPLIEEAKQGLRHVLQTLSPEDRFDLMVFRETQERLFNEWMPATPSARARANWFIEQMESRGRTDVFASLEHLLTLPTDPGRPAIAVIVTDGIPTVGVLDQSTILERFTRANDGHVSVFMFGAGARVDHFLLDFLGLKNRGDTSSVERFEDVPNALRELAREIARPVLAHPSFQLSGAPADDAYPRTLTHLYLDRPLVLHGRAPARVPEAGLRIVGQAGPRRLDTVHRLVWAEAEDGGPRVRTEWARRKSVHLVGEHLVTGDPQLLRQLRDLERRTGVRTPYAETLGAR